MELVQLVTFAILMESGRGILDKGPAYILEKWGLCRSTKSVVYLEGMLDSENKAKLTLWLHRWED